MTILEQELVELKTRVEWLEATVRRLVSDRHKVARSAPSESLDKKQLLAWLKAEGLIVEPPSVAQAHAKRWRALSEEEKQTIRWELDHLPPGPMASDIVIENRG